MKNFARHWIDPVFQFSSLLFIMVSHVSLLIGVTLGLALQSWVIGLSTGAGLIILVYVFLVLIWHASKKYVSLLSKFKTKTTTNLCYPHSIKLNFIFNSKVRLVMALQFHRSSQYKIKLSETFATSDFLSSTNG